MIALLFASHKKIHMVSPNEELVKRDKVDFKNLFLFLTEDEPDIVDNHVGIAYKPTENALVIVDEADYFIIDDPLKFKLFV